MISIYLNGRLGNQLFQYVFCRIASIKNNCNFYIPSNMDESIKFYGLCNRKLNKNLQLPVDTNPHYWVANNLFDLDFGINDYKISKFIQEDSIDHKLDMDNITDETLIYSFCQFESNLIDHIDIIRNDWFVFKPNIIESCMSIMGKYNIEEYCVIHFRGGDYKSISQFYLPISYFEKAKSELSDKNLKYLIITDDVEEAIKYFPNDEIISNTMEIDFCLLTMFKYMIIPNSSFSWWSAWLNKNNPLVIAPNRWFNYNNSGNFFPIGLYTTTFRFI